MTALELGIKLKALYSHKNADKVAMIHLFGIIFAQTMDSENIKPIEVLKAAQMPESYQREIYKGKKLSKYVKVRDEYKDLVALLKE